MSGFDLNFDGRDDLILVNAQAGLAISWLGQPGGRASPHPEGADPFYFGALAGVGDFNGDGRGDTLWRIPSGLSVAGTWPDGGFYFVWSHAWVGPLASNWKIVGTGDFNRDGVDDVLLQRADGYVTNWLGNPAAIYDFIKNDANASISFTPDWRVIKTGDFNGDGYADMLLRRDDGWVTNWLGAANGQFANNGANTSLYFTSDWSVIGAGDFNGDGRDDLLLRRSDGWITNWLATANGGFANNGGNAAVLVANDWKIVSIGDFDGDGRDDLMFRRDDGWVTDWLGTETGAFQNNGANFSVFIDPAWQIVDPSVGASGWNYY